MARSQMFFSLSNVLESCDCEFIMSQAPGWVLGEMQRVKRGSCPPGLIDTNE